MFAQTAIRVSEYRPRSSMPAHDHDQPSFGIVVGGDFREQIGRSERVYTKGHVTFCPAGLPHSQEFGASGARQIIFAPKESWLSYLADCKTDLGAAPHANAALFRSLGDRLLEETRHGDAFSTIACEGILLEIVAGFGRAGASAHANAQPPAWLRTAREFIRENFCRSLEMGQIARAAGRHEIHLAREFRRYYGTSVGTYIRVLRTEQAAKLLLEPHASLGDVAHACGFSSHAHLCREFKARFGVTPGEFRARNG